MVTNKIKQRIFIMLMVVTLATAGIFTVLIQYNNRATVNTAAELGSMYMSEMMYQMQDHFESIVKLKGQEAVHVAQHPMQNVVGSCREVLVENAQMFEFDYLAFYDDNGAYETLLGETAWYRNLSGFIEQVKTEKTAVTTGYLTSSGQKYLVFGVPAQYDMSNGKTSSVLLIGFHVEKLYDYIHIETLQQFGSEARLDIILTNGSFVLNKGAGKNTSYFDRISQYGSFVGMDTVAGVEQIETAMASGKSFTHTVTLDGVTKHIYGAPAGTPADWYFVISMPQGTTDQLLNQQNLVNIRAFCLAGLVMFLLFLAVFLYYLRMSLRQIKETEIARAEAEIANNAKSSFLSNMSHDIRTPMNAIAGFAAIAEDSIQHGKQEDALEALSKMKRSSEYLRSLIGDVLDMSKIESGKLTLLPEPVSLKETVDMVNTIAMVRAEMKNQNYEVYVHDILHDAIECDQTRLNQVLINLLGNAVKFTNDGGKIEFEVWQEPSDKGSDFVRSYFMVRDNGIGMSPEFVRNMFESFSREENKVRKIEGTGLGLTISKRLIDMMEGTIQVESEEGKGSQFCVIVDFPKTAEITPITAEHVADMELEGIRILLAEDNDFNFEIAQVLLEGNNFAVKRAENGEEAVKLYCDAPDQWDLILMDLRMPIMDGYQAAEKIRAFEEAQSETLHIPIVALSADVFAEDIERCMKAGMNGHLSKPIDLHELLRTIRKHMK